MVYHVEEKMEPYSRLLKNSKMKLCHIIPNSVKDFVKQSKSEAKRKILGDAYQGISISLIRMRRCT